MSYEPGPVGWAWLRMVAEDVAATLEKLEPQEQRRVLIAAAVLLGHEALARELLEATP